MKKNSHKKHVVIEVSFEETPKPKLYTQEEVEELLSQQRQICADYADTRRDTVYIDCTVGYGDIMIVDKDSITNAPMPEL